MKRKFVQIAALTLSAVLFIVSGGRQSVYAGSAGTSAGRVIRVGLHHDGPYGTGSMEGINLENSVGSGFRFGYYDSSDQFVHLGSTEQTAISVVKTQNVYYGTYNGYRSYHTALTSSSVAVGDYHLELPGTYSSFAKAKAAAAGYEGGFPAWIGGEFHARIGNYTTRDKALAAQTVLAGQGVETVIKGTSVYGLSVVVTGTNDILFQFDDLGEGTGLGIEPNAVDIPEDEPGDEPETSPGDIPGDGPETSPGDVPEDGPETSLGDIPEDGPETSPGDVPEDGTGGVETYSTGDGGGTDGVKYATWTKGYRYYGGFRYERIGGGNITVVNILDMEDYVKGVVPHEMSNSWPIEALKAQAVAARSYALSLGTKHSSGHFDICDNTHCQAYSGLTRAGSNSDAAVDQTAGQFALYNGKLASTYYYSSNGGASESVSVVWGSNQASYPYLVGREDPYEDSINVNNGYTRTVTSDTLVAKLKDLGYNDVGTSIVSVAIVSLTDAGNPKQVTFTDNNGKKFTINTRYVKDMVGLRSYCYGLESAASGVSVNGGHPEGIAGLYVIDGNESVTPVAGDVYVLTGGGTVHLEQSDAETAGGIRSLGSSTGNNGTFTFVGRGWGHNVGMSQWGAYAMANLGKTYLEILQFYYTGITVGFM